MTTAKNIFILIILTVFLTACKSAPILNINDDQFEAQNKTMDEVTQGIKLAGAGLGWRMEKIKPGLIVATLYLRTHMAKVNISYNTKSYSINYKDSTNLDYQQNSSNHDGQDAIHSNYNGWIQNLSNAIQQQVY